MSGPFVVPTYCRLHILALIVGVEGYPLNSGISPFIDTYINPEHCEPYGRTYTAVACKVP